MPLPLINGTSCKRSGGNDAASRQRRAALHQKSALCKAPSHRALLWCRAALRCRMVWRCATLQRRWLDLVDFNRHLYAGGRQFSVACWIGSWANLQHCCRHCTILNYSTSWWNSALCKWAYEPLRPLATMPLPLTLTCVKGQLATALRGSAVSRCAAPKQCPV